MSRLSPDQLTRLAELLADAGEHLEGPLAASILAGGRSNLTYRLDDGRSSWVLRRPPTGGVIESAHDVAREYRVIAALGKTAVPVARAVVLDAEGTVLGDPCAVVTYVDGVTARSQDDVSTWTAADFAACADGLVGALSALHSVVPGEVGLEGFGRPDGYALRQLRRWSGQWERMSGSDPRADRLHGLLAERLPQQRRSTVVHGDFRVDNVLLDRADPGRVLAVVDWELSTIGDPVADVATMCAYRHPALDDVLGLRAAWTSDGFPTGEELRDLYASRSGLSMGDFGFHLALAYYKLAVIAAGIAYRHRLGVTSGEGYEDVALAVPVLLEAGLDAVDSDG